MFTDTACMDMNPQLFRFVLVAQSSNDNQGRRASVCRYCGRTADQQHNSRPGPTTDRAGSDASFDLINPLIDG